MLQFYRFANVFCDPGHRQHKSALYLQNVIWFHGRLVNVISFTPIREVSPSMHQHCNTQQQDILASFKVDNKCAKWGKKLIYAPTYNMDFSAQTAQSSMFYNKKDHSLNTHNCHNSNLYFLRSALFCDLCSRNGSFAPTFQDNLLVPSSRVK